MPGDMSASLTTFPTVVRDGPWMCSAEMHASISRCRCRTRDARSGATATAVLDSRPVTTLTVYRAQSPEGTIKREMKLNGHPGRWRIILPPLLFLLVFFLIPFAFALYISFAEVAA